MINLRCTLSLVLFGRIMHTSEPRKPKRQNAREEKDKLEDSKDIQEEREQEDTVPSPAAFDDRSGPMFHVDDDFMYMLHESNRSSKLTDDVLHIVFCYLKLKDRIRVERGDLTLAKYGYL